MQEDNSHHTLSIYREELKTDGKVTIPFFSAYDKRHKTHYFYTVPYMLNKEASKDDKRWLYYNHKTKEYYLSQDKRSPFVPGEGDVSWNGSRYMPTPLPWYQSNQFYIALRYSLIIFFFILLLAAIVFYLGYWSFFFYNVKGNEGGMSGR